jgi:hypothetical protein
MNLPRIKETRSRYEIFIEVKPDLIHSVPFYSSGYYHLCPEERVTLPDYSSRGKAFTCKDRPCRMLCYVDAYVDHTIKNSYIILTETVSIFVRHDCYFRHFTPFPSLLNVEVENRHLPPSSEKLQSIMMTCSSTFERTMTPQMEIIYNQLITTLTMISTRSSRARFNTTSILNTAQPMVSQRSCHTSTTKRRRSFF